MNFDADVKVKVAISMTELHRAVLFSIGRNQQDGFATEAQLAEYFSKMANLTLRLARVSSVDMKLMLDSELEFAIAIFSMLSNGNSLERYEGGNVDVSRSESRELDVRLLKTYKLIKESSDLIDFYSSIPHLIDLCELIYLYEKQVVLCTICPRLARPGELYCDYHSRAKSLGGTVAEKMSRLRIGKRVALLFNERYPKARIRLSRKLPFHVWAAKVLWGSNYANYSSHLGAVRNLLNESDLLVVDSSIIHRLADSEFEMMLRDQFDRREYRVGAWMTKLQYLSKWKSLEQIVMSTRHLDCQG